MESNMPEDVDDEARMVGGLLGGLWLQAVAGAGAFLLAWYWWGVGWVSTLAYMAVPLLFTGGGIAWLFVTATEARE